MFMRLIRSLMPREEPFVAHFVEHAACLVKAAEALKVMMTADASAREACFTNVCAIEGQADAIARETMVTLHRAFMTPFDRSGIHSFVTAQDDAVDLIEDVAQRAILYRIAEYDPFMLELAGQIGECANLLAEAIPMLKDISGNAEHINALCERVGKIESDADATLRRALSELFRDPPDTITLMARKEIYELLETVTDRCDDVADLIDGIVLDNV